MAKGGISLLAGITIAGLLGTIVFTTGIIPAVTGFLSDGAGIESNQDFQEFSQALSEVCSEDNYINSATGGISEYSASIQFPEDKRVALIEGGEVVDSKDLECPVMDYDEKTLDGTISYTIDRQGGQLVVQTEGG